MRALTIITSISYAKRKNCAGLERQPVPAHAADPVNIPALLLKRAGTGKATTRCAGFSAVMVKRHLPTLNGLREY